MKYAVTGGLGFIGSNICRILLKKGHQVVIIDNCNTGNETKISDILNQVELYKNDIREKNEIKKFLEDVDGIFHNVLILIACSKPCQASPGPNSERSARLCQART